MSRQLVLARVTSTILQFCASLLLGNVPLRRTMTVSESISSVIFIFLGVTENKVFVARYGISYGGVAQW